MAMIDVVGTAGPVDIGSNVALPRRPISSDFAKQLEQKVAHVSFASNPCRLRFYTQEIVFFREDLLRKMQRHLAVPLVLPGSQAAGGGGGDDDDADVPDITEQLVESLLDQAHLCPLPLRARPVHWELDHTLRLFPLPHLVRTGSACVLRGRTVPTADVLCVCVRVCVYLRCAAVDTRGSHGAFQPLLQGLPSCQPR